MKANPPRRTRSRVAVAVALLAVLLVPVADPASAGAIAAGPEPIFLAPWECGKTMNAASRAGHIPAIDFHGFGSEWDPNDVRPIGDDERGAPVLAMAAGTAETSFGDMAGHTVTIDHGNDWATVYLHLEREGVSGSVSVGQIIGTMGDSGNANGAHLHVHVVRDGNRVPIRFGGSLVPFGNTDSLGPASGKFPAVKSGNCGGDPAPQPSGAVATVHLANAHSSQIDRTVAFGKPGDAVVAGDFDGDGRSDLANRTNNIFEVVPANGRPRFIISYGIKGDQLFVGDWDCDGDKTLAVRRGNVFFLKNTFTSGVADIVIGYGRADDEVFVGDWNRDGCDTFAVRRGNKFLVRLSITTGVADFTFSFGRPGDDIYIGDFDGNGADSMAVRRDTTMFIRNSLTSGVADFTYEFGRASDAIVAGDWDGDGNHTFGAVRVE